MKIRGEIGIIHGRGGKYDCFSPLSFYLMPYFNGNAFFRLVKCSERVICVCKLIGIARGKK